MPELLPRANERVDTSRRPRPSIVAAVLAAVVTAVVGLVVCAAVTAVVWVSGDTGTFVDAVRAGGLVWLMGHGSGAEGGGVAITMVPLGSVVLMVTVLARMTRAARGDHAVSTRGDAARLVLGVTVTYAVLAGVVTAVVQTAGPAPGLWRACLAAGAVAVLGSLVGALRGSELVADTIYDLPPQVSRWAGPVLRGAAISCLALLTAGGLLLAVGLVLHLGTAITITDKMGAGVVGGLAVAVLGLVLVPNAVVAAGSYLAGPGFAVGAGTAVSPLGVNLGAVPLFPMLAALPDDGDPASWQNVFLAAPILAGVVAGVVLARREPLVHWASGLGRPALAGLVGGLGFGLLCWLSQGSVGPGRMADVGPAVWATTLVVSASMLVGALVGAGATYAWAGRQARPAKADD